MALSADRNTQAMGVGLPVRMSYPQGANTIYKGSLVALNSSGHAVAASLTTGLQIVGRASQNQTNSGSAGSVNIEVEQGVFEWAVNGTAVSAAHIGMPCYAYDDATVTIAPSGASAAGTIYGSSVSGYAWVYSALDSNVTDSAQALSASGVPKTVSFSLVAVASSGDVVGRWKPGVAGYISRVDGYCTSGTATGSKTGTFGVRISGTAIGGGLVSGTSAAWQTIGSKVSGTAVTSNNYFTATQELTLVATGVTAFADGAVNVDIFFGQ